MGGAYKCLNCVAFSSIILSSSASSAFLSLDLLRRVLDFVISSSIFVPAFPSDIHTLFQWSKGHKFFTTALNREEGCELLNDDITYLQCWQEN